MAEGYRMTDSDTSSGDTEWCPDCDTEFDPDEVENSWSSEDPMGRTRYVRCPDCREWWVLQNLRHGVHRSLQPDTDRSAAE
jgi:DNA-directed RNA polymerase subunit RPC12/RpoP